MFLSNTSDVSVFPHTNKRLKILWRYNYPNFAEHHNCCFTDKRFGIDKDSIHIKKHTSYHLNNLSNSSILALSSGLLFPVISVINVIFAAFSSTSILSKA